MITLLKSVRRKLLGETRAIPIGIAAAILLASLPRALLPRGEWQTAGAFALAAAIIVTLIISLSADLRGPDKRRAGNPDSNTTTRTNQ